MFGAPSCASRRIRTRISSLILGRPPRGQDFQRQYSRKPARCQPTTVSGLTITSASFQRDQVIRKTVQKSRSKGRNGGLGRLRFRTATCWRRARTTTAMSVRLSKKTRAAAIRARTNGSTDYSVLHDITLRRQRGPLVRKPLNSLWVGLWQDTGSGPRIQPQSRLRQSANPPSQEALVLSGY